MFWSCRACAGLQVIGKKKDRVVRASAPSDGRKLFNLSRIRGTRQANRGWGNWVISREFNAAMLAEALCKLEGFQYDPSDSVYWQHGHSTERDFIYVTTQHLTGDQLTQISEEVGPNRTLLIMCTAFRGRVERLSNLTVKKIPKQILSRCEWGHDDYSLEVENLPKAPRKAGQQSLFEEASP